MPNNAKQKISYLQQKVENFWDDQNNDTFTSTEDISATINDIINLIDSGSLRVAEKIGNQWKINEWVKKSILLFFKLNKMQLVQSGQSQNNSNSSWYDKVPSKFLAWDESKYKEAAFRSVPGCYVRKGSYIGKNVVLMPSFVNIGAYVGDNTMIDTWTTIGSCAQIGSNCHISGGVGIGGVLEPLQASPVIIEDDCFIGARTEIAEGVIVEQGSVISMGVFLGKSTKIVNRETGEIFYNRIPKYSVVIPGTLPNADPKKPSLACAVIVKTVDAQTRSKTSINELLR
jgi:2,3,4,5-tetrahydropyridine-2,6-dicarboxylate N-succinyltransferase